MDLQYWIGGQSVLPSDDAGIKALKYWKEGKPSIEGIPLEAAAAPSTSIKDVIGGTGMVPFLR